MEQIKEIIIKKLVDVEDNDHVLNAISLMKASENANLDVECQVITNEQTFETAMSLIHTEPFFYIFSRTSVSGMVGTENFFRNKELLQSQFNVNLFNKSELNEYQQKVFEEFLDYIEKSCLSDLNVKMRIAMGSREFLNKQLPTKLEEAAQIASNTFGNKLSKEEILIIYDMIAEVAQ